jgi:hypothetical protein
MFKTYIQSLAIISDNCLLHESAAPLELNPVHRDESHR